MYLYLALKVAAHGLTELFNESNKWKAGGVVKSAIQSNGELYAAGLRYHGVAMLAMAAFGVPAFTAEDEAATYVCLVPLAAGLFMCTQLMAAGANPSEEHPVASCVENNAVPADEVVPEVAVEKQEEAKTEEVKTPEESQEKEEEIKENGEAVPVANGIEPEPKEVQEADIGDQDEELKKKKLLLLFESFYQTCVCKTKAVVDTLTSQLCRVAGLVMRVPWYTLTFCLTTTLSHVVCALAWYTLTDNLLAASLPLYGLVLPYLVDKWGQSLPSATPDLLGGAAALTELLVLSGVHVV